MPRKANSNLDISDMIGAGGITPIVPSSSLNYSKKLENPFEPKFEESNVGRVNISRQNSLHIE